MRGGSGLMYAGRTPGWRCGGTDPGIEAVEECVCWGVRIGGIVCGRAMLAIGIGGGEPWTRVAWRSPPMAAELMSVLKFIGRESVG